MSGSIQTKMAAYTVCMCFARQCRDLRISRSFVRFLRHCEYSDTFVTRRLKHTIPAQINCLYTTQATGTTRITDQFLKEKLAAASNDNPPDDKNKEGSENASGKGQEPGKDSDKKGGKWTGKNAWKLGLAFLGGWCLLSGGFLIYAWGSPPLDPDGKEVEDEFSQMPKFLAMFKRASKELNLFTKKIKEPSRDKLLPDPLQYPYLQPPYTLVMEMTGVLVHPDWTYGTGWRFKKRPGIDYFLHQVGPPLFEIVIYTQEQGMTADPLVSSLDPNGYIMYRLYRDATRYQNGHHIKDLACLNRDLSKVIMVEWNPNATELNPRNTLLIPKWTGSDDDRTLIDLAHFLKTIASSGVEDVRNVIEYYSQFDDPIAAFRENQRKLQEEQERLAQEYKDKEEKKSIWGGLGLFKRR
ncbi:mitochondrial import inner membrane translocase subunit TIM50-like [Pomacea canaliculata]|uniref:mitochondrial import inner membrane translocase subunit TIM50-like n=1 Tax=Pomacea canaliculata TaxID=400727 RepID=UPI000D72AD95|nr:mitochondrial import inner membrane translocase subunit TIM50-like [Pomacea canaliculata]